MSSVLESVQLVERLGELVRTGTGRCRSLVATAVESLSSMATGSRDPRLRRLERAVRDLDRQLAILEEVAADDALGALESDLRAMAARDTDFRIVEVMLDLVGQEPGTLTDLTDVVLDLMVDRCRAERGCILFVSSDGSEAAVASARNFQSVDLSVEEYNLSLSVVRSVLRTGKPLLLDDVSGDATYSGQSSVRRYSLRSVLAAPLRDGNRGIGAIYLEDSREPARFDDRDLRLLEGVARVAVFCLRHSRLLPYGLSSGQATTIEPNRGDTLIVGEAPAMREVLELIDRVADSPAPVLVNGESGTGKELVARALHVRSARADAPFVIVNCATIPESLAESELFGYEKGAFTGAHERYLGRIEQAEGGTVFFDEVGELPPSQQAKLLRFAQSREISRVGGRATVVSGARIVAATSRDLRSMVEAGRFLDSLYYRLSVIPLTIPPLREREGDVDLLLHHFVARFSELYGVAIDLDPGVSRVLSQYPFPGNVRELENLVHRLVALSPDGTIRVGDLPREVLGRSPTRLPIQVGGDGNRLPDPPDEFGQLRSYKEAVAAAIAEHELRLARAAVEDAGGNVSVAARRLGIHRVTLHKILARGHKDEGHGGLRD